MNNYEDYTTPELKAYLLSCQEKLILEERKLKISYNNLSKANKVNNGVKDALRSLNNNSIAIETIKDIILSINQELMIRKANEENVKVKKIMKDKRIRA